MYHNLINIESLEEYWSKIIQNEAENISARHQRPAKISFRADHLFYRKLKKCNTMSIFRKMKSSTNWSKLFTPIYFYSENSDDNTLCLQIMITRLMKSLIQNS